MERMEKRTEERGDESSPEWIWGQRLEVEFGKWYVIGTLTLLVPQSVYVLRCLGVHTSVPYKKGPHLN